MRIPSPGTGWPVTMCYRRAQRGFSLIEVLTVLAVLSIMAALSIPSLNSMGQSAALASAGNDVADLATFAHDYALSHNQMTALVGVTTSTGVPSNAQYRCFVVMAATTTSNWTQVSRWLWLPSAATMSSNSSVNTFASQTGAAFTPNFGNSLVLNGIPVTGGYVYQVFYPDGHMDTTAASLTLRLVNSLNQSSPNFYDVVFNPMTGTIKVNRP